MVFPLKEVFASALYQSPINRTPRINANTYPTHLLRMLIGLSLLKKIGSSP